MKKRSLKRYIRHGYEALVLSISGFAINFTAIHLLDSIHNRTFTLALTITALSIAKNIFWRSHFHHKDKIRRKKKYSQVNPKSDCKITR